MTTLSFMNSAYQIIYQSCGLIQSLSRGGNSWFMNADEIPDKVRMCNFIGKFSTSPAGSTKEYLENLNKVLLMILEDFDIPPMVYPKLPDVKIKFYSDFDASIFDRCNAVIDYISKYIDKFSYKYDDDDEQAFRSAIFSLYLVITVAITILNLADEGYKNRRSKSGPSKKYGKIIAKIEFLKVELEDRSIHMKMLM